MDAKPIWRESYPAAESDAALVRLTVQHITPDAGMGKSAESAFPVLTVPPLYLKSTQEMRLRVVNGRAALEVYDL